VAARWKPQAALGVVMAADGYPGSYAKGDVINGLPPAADDMHVFHAGTSANDNDIITSGGRVLCVCALGDSVAAAAQRAYAGAAQVSWRVAWYRGHICDRSIVRECG